MKALQFYISKMLVDTAFCSTRATRRLFQGSFSKKATRIGLRCDVAVVRIVNIGSARNHRSLMLAIKDTRLDVRKFTFFASLASAYETPAEIYSIKVMHLRALALLDIGSIKRILRRIDNQLLHYRKLAALANLNFRLKHAITTMEHGSIIHHVLSTGHDLIIIGGSRLSVIPTLEGEKPIERLMRETPVNLIAYCPGESVA